MGWASGGPDDRGRMIGYGHACKCEHKGCRVRIDRGLAFACGGEHGSGTYYCDAYVCEKHMGCIELPNGKGLSVCVTCQHEYEAKHPDPEDEPQAAHAA